MQKISFKIPVVFEILKFKNPAIWLAERIFAFNSRTRFFPDMRGFNRIIKVIMVHDLKQKKLYITGLIFFFFFFYKIQKNPIFEVFWGIIPKMRFFPKNPALSVFHPWGTLNSWEVLEKSYEPFWRKRVYLLTYWHTDSGEIIGPLLA